MTTSTRVHPGLAIPPGETVQEELDARGLSQLQLALLIGRPPQVVNEICRGKKAITADTALALESVLDGISAEFWLRLQADYHLAVARLRRLPSPEPRP